VVQEVLPYAQELGFELQVRSGVLLLSRLMTCRTSSQSLARPAQPALSANVLSESCHACRRRCPGGLDEGYLCFQAAKSSSVQVTGGISYDMLPII
jgi:hypothetical protein